MTDSPPFDVIVAGLGAMGSAAAWQLAARGARVLGLDRLAPPHVHGSTHGRSRIIREAYYEDPAYVPLVRRALELWEALERESGRALYRRTGGLMLGPARGTLVAGARRSAIEHDLPYEELAAAAVRHRAPAIHAPDDWVGLFESRAGVLDPERCVEAMLDGARRYGAVLRTEEPLVDFGAHGRAVTVRTARGRYEARALVLAVGAWLPRVLPALAPALQVERQVMLWLAPAAHPEWFRADRLPIAMLEYAPDRFFYVIPDSGHGVKVAIHHEGEVVDPDAARTPVSAADVERVRALVARFLPDADGELLDGATCLYTNTPDCHFLIDRHPRHAGVVVASPCSGHGFKFAPAIGEALADLALGEAPRADLRPFAFSAERGLGAAVG